MADLSTESNVFVKSTKIVKSGRFWSRALSMICRIACIYYLLQRTDHPLEASLVWSEYLLDWTINAIKYHPVLDLSGY